MEVVVHSVADCFQHIIWEVDGIHASHVDSHEELLDMVWGLIRHWRLISEEPCVLFPDTNGQILCREEVVLLCLYWRWAVLFKIPICLEICPSFNDSCLFLIGFLWNFIGVYCILLMKRHLRLDACLNPHIARFRFPSLLLFFNFNSLYYFDHCTVLFITVCNLVLHLSIVNNNWILWHEGHCSMIVIRSFHSWWLWLRLYFPFLLAAWSPLYHSPAAVSL